MPGHGKERCLADEIRAGKTERKRPGLQRLMRYAINNQLVKNEGFAFWVRAQDPEWDPMASLEEALPKFETIMPTGATALPQRHWASSNWYTRSSVNCSRRPCGHFDPSRTLDLERS